MTHISTVDCTEITKDRPELWFWFWNVVGKLPMGYRGNVEYTEMSYGRPQMILEAAQRWCFCNVLVQTVPLQNWSREEGILVG